MKSLERLFFPLLIFVLGEIMIRVTGSDMFFYYVIILEIMYIIYIVEKNREDINLGHLIYESLKDIGDNIQKLKNSDDKMEMLIYFVEIKSDCKKNIDLISFNRSDEESDNAISDLLVAIYIYIENINLKEIIKEDLELYVNELYELNLIFRSKQDIILKRYYRNNLFFLDEFNKAIIKYPENRILIEYSKSIDLFEN